MGFLADTYTNTHTKDPEYKDLVKVESRTKTTRLYNPPSVTEITFDKTYVKMGKAVSERVYVKFILFLWRSGRQNIMKS